MSDADLEVQKTIEKHWRAMERQRIIELIEQIDNHGMTHSEKCLRWHLFAERLTKAIEGGKQ